MRLERPFLKLPIRFDADALAAEVRALPASAWVPHPTGYPGNEAVRLVTPGGAATDAFDGPMRGTEQLARCPYVQQVMAALDGVWGRSRFMGLGAGAEVPEHVDCHYHWRTHLRIHVPVITNPAVEFTCGGETVHMAPGDCWVFDSFRWHEVHNRGTVQRVHLVLDSVVSPRLWDLIDAAHSGGGEPATLIEPNGGAAPPLRFERINMPSIMSPWEMRGHIAFMLGEIEASPVLEAVAFQLERLADGWAALWAEYGESADAAPAYRQALAEGRAAVAAAGADTIELRNELKLLFVFDQLIGIIAVDKGLGAALGAQRLAS